jgi:hypothetical protein
MARRSRTERPSPISRRRFVALVAAGSAALLAPAAGAAPAAARRPAKPVPGAPARPSALQAELDRQRASTMAALATIRAHALPVGAESASVFRPLKRTRGR